MDGDGTVCTMVGDEYSRGSSGALGFFPQSDSLAAQYYGRGCAAGVPESCGQLGQLTITGRGVPEDDTKGAALLINACDRGYLRACANAGRALVGGVGIEVDAVRGLRYLNLACKNGDATACTASTQLVGTGETANCDAPLGAVGFTFGSTPATAKLACEKAGHHFSRDSKEHNEYECDGTVTPPDLSFRASLTICGDGRVCSIDLFERLTESDFSKWLGRLAEVEKTMTDRYGEPYSRKWELPKECRPAAAFAHCLETGKAAFDVTWVWPSGHVVSADISILNGERGELKILYSTPESLKPYAAAGL